MFEEHCPHNQKWATWREALLRWPARPASSNPARLVDRTSNWNSLPSRKYRKGAEQAGLAQCKSIALTGCGRQANF